MKKLFSTNINGIADVAEEGKVYGIYDYALNKWLFLDAIGQPLPNYKRPDCEASIYDDQYTDDKTQITPMIDGFYGYSTGDIRYHPDGFDGQVGIKNKDGTKITEEVFAELTHFSNGLCPVRNKEEKYAQVKLPSGEVRMVNIECRATIGQVSNVDHMNIKLGKAGKKRYLGKKPHVRGVVMNPVDHPMGGGEGRTSGGGHPVSPWGQLAKGKRTRSPKKNSSKFIVERRKK